MNNYDAFIYARAKYRATMIDLLWAIADSEGWGYMPDRWPYPFSKQYRSLTKEHVNQDIPALKTFRIAR